MPLTHQNLINARDVRIRLQIIIDNIDMMINNMDLIINTTTYKILHKMRQVTVFLPKAHIATRVCACLSACFWFFLSRGKRVSRTSRKSWAITELVSHLRIWRINISHCYNTTNNSNFRKTNSQETKQINCQIKTFT